MTYCTLYKVHGRRTRIKRSQRFRARVAAVFARSEFSPFHRGRRDFRGFPYGHVCRFVSRSSMVLDVYLFFYELTATQSETRVNRYQTLLRPTRRARLFGNISTTIYIVINGTWQKPAHKLNNRLKLDYTERQWSKPTPVAARVTG